MDVFTQYYVYTTDNHFQMLDLPGIIEGAKDGKGRGRQVIAVARTCSLIFIVLDVLKPLQHKRLIEKELEGFGIRLNKTPPNIAFKKKDEGGINLAMQVGREGERERERERERELENTSTFFTPHCPGASVHSYSGVGSLNPV